MRRLDRLAVRTAFALYLVGVLVWLALGVLPLHVDHPDMSAAALDATTAVETTVQYLFSAANVALALLLFAKRPDEPVPRLLAFAMLGTAATFNLPSHQTFHLIGSPWPVALTHFAFHIVSGVTYVWAVVLFPDGDLPRRIPLSRNGVRVLALASTVLVALVCWRSSFLDHPQFFIAFFGIAVAILGVGVQTLRIVDPDTSPRERASARLLCAALLPALAVSLVWLAARAVAAVTPAVGQAEAVQRAVEALFPAVFAVVPLVLFAGVVRYRLWDIDRILSRVLVYSLLAVALGAAYVLAVSLGGWVAGGGLWFTVLALSLAVVLVEPLRQVGRRWANRVVFGQMLSPGEAMRSLTDALQHLKPSEELDHVVAVVVAATRATGADIWLVEEGHLLRVAHAPADGSPVQPIRLPAEDRSVTAMTAAISAAISAAAVWPIEHERQLLGFLSADAPPGERLAPADDMVGRGIAAHAALLVRNANLTVALAHQVETLTHQAAELAESRRRLVRAQDAERRTLERALHDGAQQALVAAIIAARTDAARAPVPSEAVDGLRELLHIAQTDVEELGDSRPSRLARLGFTGGLQEAARVARRGGLAVDVEIEAVPDLVTQPLDPDVETVVYSCCLEGLQNVAKYAGATAARVCVRRTGDEVGFSVVDNGSGFRLESTVTAGSGGLAALAERIAALGGDISVVSGSEGTTLRGSLPLRRRVAVPG